MKKWILTIVMVLMMFPIVGAIEDCKGVMNTGDIPCILTIGYTPENICTSYQVLIYNNNATLMETQTLGTYGNTGWCNITFNHTSEGSYFLNFTTGDTAQVIVEEDEDMLLATVIGIGIIATLLFFFAFKLDDEHFILKLLMILSSISIIILIPASLIIDTAEITFYRVVLYFFVAFWLYVIGYFVYWILKRMGVIVSGESNE